MCLREKLQSWELVDVFDIWSVDARELPRRLGNIVFKQETGSTSGTLDFTWDGRSRDGQDVPNGRYFFRAQVTDVMGRVQVANTDIEVNNLGNPAPGQR